MKLAYLTTQYPKVSHTFIRREVLELERRGHQVLRLAIRASGEKLADPLDVAEQAKTFVCLNQPKFRLVQAMIGKALRHPSRWLGALGMTWAMARRSERGLGRHLAYLAEACLLLGPLQRQGIRHLHVHFGTNAAAVARLIHALTAGRITYSLTVHGPDEFDAPVALSLPDKVRDAAFTVAISRFGKAQLQRWTEPACWERLHVIGCVVDDAFLNARRPVDEQSRTLVSVGRLSAQKGQFVLVEAFAQLVQRRECADAKLVLCGDGELRPQLEAYIAKLGVTDRTIITGWISEAQVRTHLLAARALVLPSFAEGLPVVIMEALALGRPVVSTYVAGIPELVRPAGTGDQANGFLVPAGDVDALAAALHQVMTTGADELTRMGVAGAAAARRAHGVTTEVDKLEALLLTCLGRREES
jgi:glycosyltransferase involved in cell wall biosynthesis